MMKNSFNIKLGFHHGLANRLIYLIQGIKIAKERNLPASVYWPTGSHCIAELEELYDIDFLTILKHCPEKCDWPKNFMPYVIFNPKNRESSSLILNQFKYKKDFFNPQLLKEPPNDCVGIQIRSELLVRKNEDGSFNQSDIMHLFFNHIKELKYKNVFIACDNSKILSKLKDEIKNKIGNIVYDPYIGTDHDNYLREDWGRSGTGNDVDKLRSSREAFIWGLHDLTHLSRCSKIIGTPSSTFGILASLYNNIEYKALNSAGSTQ